MDSGKYLFTLAGDIQNRMLAFRGLAPKEKSFFLVWSLEAEVNNSGFDQFFSSIRPHAVATAEALWTIGAINMAAIVDRAVSPFGVE